METKAIKQVLEGIVQIDGQANKLEAELSHYLTERDERIKQRVRSMELEIMKAIRSEVKQDYDKKMAAAQKQKLQIDTSSDNYVSRVHNYIEENKEQVINRLFEEIFEVDQANG